jgi:hypothetical protein
MRGSICCCSMLAPPCFFKVPVGACAVFILEYGLNLLFSLRALSLSLSGVTSLLPSRLPRGPSFSYASKGFLKPLLLVADEPALLGC